MINNIKQAPISQISLDIQTINKRLIETRTEALRKSILARNKAILADHISSVKSYYSNELGSDGLAEGIGESLNLPDPTIVELTPIQKKECLEQAKKEVIPSFLANVKPGSWLLPQMRAHFGSWKAVAINGKFDPRTTVVENCKNNFNKGLWHLANWSRSDLIEGTMYKFPEFCSLVPLILAGFKMSQNIPYSKWSKDGLQHIVESDLAAAMLCELPKLSSEEWLMIRDHGLTIRSGARAHTMRNPRTTAMLYNLANYEGYKVDKLPKLALVMATQIWCAHPANRGPYMVLDPSNWDNVPAPLINTNMFEETVVAAELPWD